MIYFLVPSFLILYGIASSAVRPGLRRWWAKFFIGWWGLLLSVSALNPFGLYEVSPESYFLFFLFSSFYLLGFAIFLPKKRINFDEFVSRAILSYHQLIENTYFKLFLALITLTLFIYAYKYNQYIAVAGAVDSRLARFEVGKVFSSNYEIIIFEYLIGSPIWFLKFLVAFGIVFSASRNLAWFFSFSSCAFYMSFGGGRNIAFEIGLLTIFLFVARKHSNIASEPLKKNNKIILFLAILYFSSVLATFYRLSEDTISLDGFIEANLILLEHAVVYLVGSIRAFDYALANYQDIFSLKFGLLTASGLDEIASLGLRFIGFDVMPYSNYWGSILATPIAIGDHHYFNALYTALFNFYFDFGLVGVAVNSFLFGLVCSNILAISIKKGGLSLLFASGMLFVVSALSCLTWKLSAGPVVLILSVGLVHGLFPRAGSRHYKEHLEKFRHLPL